MIQSTHPQLPEQPESPQELTPEELLSPGFWDYRLESYCTTLRNTAEQHNPDHNLGDIWEIAKLQNKITHKLAHTYRSAILNVLGYNNLTFPIQVERDKNAQQIYKDILTLRSISKQFVQESGEPISPDYINKILHIFLSGPSISKATLPPNIAPAFIAAYPKYKDSPEALDFLIMIAQLPNGPEIVLESINNPKTQNAAASLLQKHLEKPSSTAKLKRIIDLAQAHPDLSKQIFQITDPSTCSPVDAEALVNTAQEFNDRVGDEKSIHRALDYLSKNKALYEHNLGMEKAMKIFWVYIHYKEEEKLIQIIQISNLVNKQRGELFKKLSDQVLDLKVNPSQYIKYLLSVHLNNPLPDLSAIRTAFMNNDKKFLKDYKKQNPSHISGSLALVRSADEEGKMSMANTKSNQGSLSIHEQQT